MLQEYYNDAEKPTKEELVEGPWVERSKGVAGTIGGIRERAGTDQDEGDRNRSGDEYCTG